MVLRSTGTDDVNVIFGKGKGLPSGLNQWSLRG